MQQATRITWNGTVRALPLESSCTPRQSPDALAGDGDASIDDIVSVLRGSGGLNKMSQIEAAPGHFGVGCMPSLSTAIKDNQL